MVGKNNPRLRKSQELAEREGRGDARALSTKTLSANGSGTRVSGGLEASDAGASERGSGTVSSERNRRIRGKRRSVADSGRVVDTGGFAVSGSSGAINSGALGNGTREPASSQDLSEARARQERMRQERIERVEQDERKRKRHRTVRRVILGVLVAVVLAFAGLVVAFGVFRWQTFDDAADIQGTWYHEETSMPITITEDEIVLTDDVAYHYVLDPEAKTILFRFGNMEGGGKYRFSLNRSELVITDGEFDWWSNFVDDALWTAQSLIAQYVFADEVPLSEGGEGESVFSREPASA